MKISIFFYPFSNYFFNMVPSDVTVWMIWKTWFETKVLPGPRWGCYSGSTCCPDTRSSWRSCQPRGRMSWRGSRGGCLRLTWRMLEAGRGRWRTLWWSRRCERGREGRGRQLSLAPSMKNKMQDINNVLFSILRFSPPRTRPGRHQSGSCPARWRSCPGTRCYTGYRIITPDIVLPSQVADVGLPGEHREPPVRPRRPVPLQVKIVGDVKSSYL